eukprot:TRINITY_DN10118_c0_g1_i1.p1 TRINITY_DN10118_c0_g1~~TRINITY_DN10118_c0_g1_i1.p1  ORF type:complete len:392 (+),score=41.99 TRINITY_DN10118_c0_g1_i1:86-1261(+)
MLCDLLLQVWRLLCDAMTDLKTRMVAWWHNSKHDSARPRFDKSADLWLLGKLYPLPDVSRNRSRANEDEAESLAETDEPYKQLSRLLCSDIRSKFWFTYRKNYAPFPGHRRTNDVGWGCMLRSGQMMMAHALVQHVKGRDWQRKTAEDEEFELKLLTLFLDDIATTRHPLSIHRLVEHTTRRADLGVGVYHTPTAVVHALAYNINSVEFQDQLRDLGATNSLHVVVAIDAILSKAELYDKLNLHPDASTSILIMIPVLLGHGEIPATYQARLRACLGSELCVGFIGGQAKHALWFIGHNGDSWLGLDPHCCYPSLRHDALEHQWDAINNTYHTQKPSFIPSPKLDPNIALGFLVTDQADVDLVLDLIGGVKVCDYIHPALLQELDIFNFAG